MGETLMPIGRFSKSCRLSIKALRHYDEQGLLRPAHVDPQTGYRYYTRGQAREAVLIGMLRALGIGVAAIREILAARDETRRAGLLAREEARVARELARTQAALVSLRRLLREGSLTPYSVRLRQEPARTVARRAIVTDAEHLIRDTTEAIYALFDELAAAGRPITGTVLTCNSDPDPEEHIRVQACVALELPPPKLPVSDVVELSGGTFAWLTHRGSYEELGLAHHAVQAWAQEHGHTQVGDVREIYVNDPADVPPEELVTEVLLPVA
jgi:DNA-binding transcriptional MerR regulator